MIYNLKKFNISLIVLFIFLRAINGIVLNREKLVELYGDDLFSLDILDKLRFYNSFSESWFIEFSFFIN